MATAEFSAEPIHEMQFACVLRGELFGCALGLSSLRALRWAKLAGKDEADCGRIFAISRFTVKY